MEGRKWLYCQKRATGQRIVRVFLNQLVPDLALMSLQRYEIDFNDISRLGLIATGSASIVQKGKRIPP